MATNYPNSLDSLTNPATTDPVNNPSHAIQHANANDAIEALQAKVGTDNSAVTTSIDYRVRQLELNFELDELHDVSIVSKTGNDILSYDSATGLWKNKSFNTLGLATQTYVDTAVQNLSNASDLEYVPIADVGQIDGVASLDSAGNVPLSQLGNLVDGAPTALDTLNELAAALGDNPNYATDITTALGNKVSKSGGSTIIPSTGSVAGLSFTPATGQTANLLEFIGGPSGGGVKVGPGGNIFDAPAINSNYAFTATAGASNVVPATIKAASGQTSNLLEYKHNNGITIGAVRNDGAVMVNNIVPLNSNTGTYASFGSDAVVFNSRSTSTPTTIIKGAASQTANLTEWQDSAGTILASVNSSGNLILGTQYISYTAASAFARFTLLDSFTNQTILYPASAGFLVQNLGVTGMVILKVKGVASQTGDLQQWQNSSGTVLAKVNAVGNINAVGLSLTSTVSGTQFTVDSNYGNITSRGGAIGFSGAASLNIGTNYNAQSAIVASGLSGQSVPTVIIKAVTSQSGNLTEWQNSSGAVVASIDSLGKITSYNRDTAGGNNNLTISGYYNGSTSSLDLQSNGITRASLISSGTIGTDSSFRIHTRINDVLSERFRIATTGRVGFNTNNPSSGLHFLNTIASDVGIIVQGAASQTANLQEWQNSSGSIIARITSSGGIGSTGNIYASRYYYSTNGTETGTSISFIDGSNGGGLSIRNIDLGTPNPGFDNITPLTVSGNINQTADLQRWTNSSGTVLAKVDVTGAMFTTTAAVGTDTTQVATTAFVIDQIDASVQPGALYQTTAPVNPEVGQIWIDSDDDIEAFDLTNKKTEIPASISANTNLVAGRRYFVTSASALTLTLPASPALNDEIQVIDASGNASTYNITIARNGNLINGTAGNLIIDNNGGWYSLLYTGTTYGWKVG